MVVLLASKSSQRTIQLSVQGDGDYQDFRDLFPSDLLVQSLSRRHPEVIHTLCLRALQIVYYLERAHCVRFFFYFSYVCILFSLFVFLYLIPRCVSLTPCLPIIVSFVSHFVLPVVFSFFRLLGVLVPAQFAHHDGRWRSLSRRLPFLVVFVECDDNVGCRMLHQWNRAEQI